jgi:predicted RNA methylase
VERGLILTTQPGWAFATLAEFRAMEFNDYVEFHHRDSTIVLTDGSGLDPDLLDTPAEVHGQVLVASANGKADATQQLVGLLRPARMKQAVLDWLPMVKGTRPRRYSVVCEALGQTAVRRPALAQAIDEGVRAALPNWRRSSDSAVRIFCKADPFFAFVGVQIHTNLQGDDSRLPGSLRRHLASGLLQLAGVDEDSTVLDPFMGGGTILDAAMRIYGAERAIGIEVDVAAYAIAERRLANASVSLLASSFDELDLGLIDLKTKLVTNVPFGVQFERVETARLIDFLRKCSQAGATITALTSREQGSEVSRALRLQRKNVIVLGQPASILYTRR